MFKVILAVLLLLCLTACGNSVVTSEVVEEEAIELEPTLKAYCAIGQPFGYRSIYGSQMSAQAFTPTGSFELTAVRLRLWVSGSPESLDVELWEGDTKLTSWTGNCHGYPDKDPGGFVEFLASEVFLEAGYEYIIILKAEGSNKNCINWLWRGQSSGGCYYSYDNGVNWANFPDRDFLYEVWGR